MAQCGDTTAYPQFKGVDKTASATLIALPQWLATTIAKHETYFCIDCHEEMEIYLL